MLRGPIADPSLTHQLGYPACALAMPILVASLASIAGVAPFAIPGPIPKGTVSRKFAAQEALNRAKLLNIWAQAQLSAGASVTLLLRTGSAADRSTRAAAPGAAMNPV